MFEIIYLSGTLSQLSEVSQCFKLLQTACPEVEVSSQNHGISMYMYEFMFAGALQGTNV